MLGLIKRSHLVTRPFSVSLVSEKHIEVCYYIPLMDQFTPIKRASEDILITAESGSGYYRMARSPNFKLKPVFHWSSNSTIHGPYKNTN